jgi:16S rRNA (cytosine967-C5)-methyltransferase
LVDKLIPTRRAAWEIIRIAKLKDRTIHDITNEYFRRFSFSDRDKRFVRRLAQGTVKMKTRLDWELSQVFNGEWSELNYSLKIMLRLGAFQIKYMDDVPDYLSVSSIVNVAKAFHPGSAKFANALLRTYIEAKIFQPDEHSSIISWAEWLSHPIWLISRWTENWDLETAKKIAEWNNQESEMWFRLNKMLISKDELIVYLEENEYQFDFFEDNELFFKVDKQDKLLESEMFELGMFSQQNPAGGLVVDLLNPQKDEIVLDACAAPGGKATYIGQLMDNTGKIYAYDKSKLRLQRLEYLSKRLKVSNIITSKKDMTKAKIPVLKKILLDMPSTGTGILSKRGDVRWRKKPDDIYLTSAVEQQILWNAAKQLEYGGVLVYATASLEPEENWMVIDAFLNKNPHFSIDNANKYVSDKYVDDKGALVTDSVIHGIDGGFSVRLIKND